MLDVLDNQIEPLPMNRSSHIRKRPQIYYVNPFLLSGYDAWLGLFDHARGLGFNAVLMAPPFVHTPFGSLFHTSDFSRLDPCLGLSDDAITALSTLARHASERDLSLLLDISPQDERRLPDGREPALDPRQDVQKPPPFSQDGEDMEHVISRLQTRLARYGEIGLSGFRCIGLDMVPAQTWERIIGAAKASYPDLDFFAYTPGTDFAYRKALEGKGFAGSFSSFAWWDLKEGWFAEEFGLQQKIGPQIVFPEAPFFRRLAHGMDSREVLERRSIRALQLATELGSGLMIPMGFEFGASSPLDPTHGNGGGLRRLRADAIFDICAEVRAANAAKGRQPAAQYEIDRVRSDFLHPVTIITQRREDRSQGGDLRLVVVNRDLRRSVPPRSTLLRQAASPFLISNDNLIGARLAPAEVRSLDAHRADPVVAREGHLAVGEATASPRIAIEKISPRVDGGRFPVKRIVGDPVLVEADIFADGHDVLAAALLYRAQDEADWRETGMSLFENDRWRGAFSIDRNGRYEFCIEAWKNPFAIYRYELTKKHQARLDLRLEVIEGITLVEQAAANPADAMDPGHKAELAALLETLKQTTDAQKIELLLSARAAELMALADRRPFRVRSEPSLVDAERLKAGFASWYQIFPRSQSGDPARHGTFDDVIARLPAIRDMGFDVLYFPPVHPIGHTNRKGRNNSLDAAPEDPGSPYAIGSEEGGHDAIHPELGSFDDFNRLVEAAAKEGLEIALDLAIQASPDHPWLKQHPGWFDWRPDGTSGFVGNGNSRNVGRTTIP